MQRAVGRLALVEKDAKASGSRRPSPLCCRRRPRRRDPVNWRWWRRIAKSRRRGPCMAPRRAPDGMVPVGEARPTSDAFAALPDELVVEVAMATRSATAVCRLQATCRRMARICADDGLWRRLYHACHGEPLHRMFTAHGKDWRWLHRAVTAAPPGRSPATGPGRAVRNSVVFMGDLVGGEPHGYGLAAEVTDGGASTEEMPEKRMVLATFEGAWVNGREHGYGVEEIVGQGTYTGMWAAGERQGRGVCTWVGGERYDGEWHAGKKHGPGTYTWPDGGSYRGMWADDRENGFGHMTHASGVRFVGQFRKGERRGHGVQIERDGRIAMGYWRGFRRGKGAHIDADGTFYQCAWTNGHLTGDIVRIAPDGTVAADPHTADAQGHALPPP
ncbi:Morn repeat domain containing protein [Pandoravirus dulcis]|uniref:Morn repeat domain containing protein n=1 Tax=Pandoravirus dulcis TaxID=1349409 RepID=S4VR56_9VIRU|nr:Morn repeat domain containing protein [Pandoravirus dulcis]AGO82848.1 Morn repeat domain containing protein [Pandoravirus dulcis]